MRSNQTARQRVAFYTTAVTAEFQRQLYNFWQHHYLLATPCLPTCPLHILLVHFWSETDHFPALRLKSHLVLRYTATFSFHWTFQAKFNFFTYYIFTSQDCLKFMFRVRTMTMASYISKKLVGCERKNFCVTFTPFICLFSGIVVLNHSGAASDNLIIFMGQFAYGMAQRITLLIE